MKKTVFDIVGWAIALMGCVVYMLTLEPSVSFWDCGEFIATSHKLMIGHPPGAPLYQLLAHCFTLFANGDVMRIAWWSNTLSALSAGFTAMFLFWSIARILALVNHNSPFDSKHLLPAIIGSACYLFCDTAWFSAVESEVYSLSMLFSAVIIWCMLKWVDCNDVTMSRRWILLVALLLGLSMGVHLLSLLTLPAIAVIYFTQRKTKSEWRNKVSTLLMALFLFVIGASTYMIIPIRAAANPPINMGDPSTAQKLRQYISREQYEHAPLIYGRCFNSPIVDYSDGKPVYAKEMNMLFPRMWKQHANAETYYTDWCGRHGKMVRVGGQDYYKPSFGDNLVVFGGYQLAYMYLRYLMWNFAGRYDDRQGFGNMQKGQFITGIPFIDRLYIGTGAPMPDSLPRNGHNRYYLLPLILGIVGVFFSRKDKKVFWTLMMLFLTSSFLLAVYLNHPVYEPRERDYAYILSFYTFSLWIGLGAYKISTISIRRPSHRPDNPSPLGMHLKSVLLLCVPLLMACQNWDDHDRSKRYVAHDSAANLLNSCDSGALLFTVGDNDTFPLWYMQYVEGFRTDVQLVNISLLGSDSYLSSVIKQLQRQGDTLKFRQEDLRQMGPWRRMMTIINNCSRPVHFSHYAANDQRLRANPQLQLCGISYRLADSLMSDSVDLDRSYRLFTRTLTWHPVTDVYIDEVSSNFLVQYWNDALLVAENLAGQGRPDDGLEVLRAAMRQVPVNVIKNLYVEHRAVLAYTLCGDTITADTLATSLRTHVDEQLAYYNTISPSMQAFIPYTLEPLRKLKEEL